MSFASMLIVFAHIDPIFSDFLWILKSIIGSYRILFFWNHVSLLHIDIFNFVLILVQHNASFYSKRKKTKITWHKGKKGKQIVQKELSSLSLLL